MYSYRHYTKSNPMSAWGHAMFADNEDSIYCYGDHYFRVGWDKLVDIESMMPEIIAAVEADGAASLLPVWMQEVYDEQGAEAIASAYNPVDIVDSAGAWDNDEYVTWFADSILSAHEIAGVKTQDGAIVFDANVIEAHDPDAD